MIGTECPYLCCYLSEAEELLWLRSGETAHRVAAAVAHDGRAGQRPWANSWDREGDFAGRLRRFSLNRLWIRRHLRAKAELTQLPKFH